MRVCPLPELQLEELFVAMRSLLLKITGQSHLKILFKNDIIFQSNFNLKLQRCDIYLEEHIGLEDLMKKLEINHNLKNGMKKQLNI